MMAWHKNIIKCFSSNFFSQYDWHQLCKSSANIFVYFYSVSALRNDCAIIGFSSLRLFMGKVAAEIAAEQALACSALGGTLAGAHAMIRRRPAVSHAGYAFANIFILSFSFFTAYDVLKKTTTINPVVACASSASITGIAWGGIFGGVRTAAKAAAVFPMIALVGFYAHDRADEWRRAEALKRAREKLSDEDGRHE